MTADEALEALVTEHGDRLLGARPATVRSLAARGIAALRATDIEALA